MHPGIIADRSPDKIAYTMAETGVNITCGELEAAANQGAHLFRSLGLKRGDHIAILLENHPLFFQICWAAQRSGLYYTTISWRLQQAEVEYIVNNCEAKVFITSAARRAVVEPLVGPNAERHPRLSWSTVRRRDSSPGKRRLAEHADHADRRSAGRPWRCSTRPAPRVIRRV